MTDFEDDELIIVQLPRKDYELMRSMIEREKVWSWLGNAFRASAVWVIAGGLLSVILLWDRIHGFFIGN